MSRPSNKFARGSTSMDKPAISPSETATATAPSATASAPVHGRWTARFALLLGLVTLTAVAYLGYRFVYLQPLTVQAQQTQASLEQLELRMLAELDASMLQTQQSVADLAAELEADNRAVQQALEQAVAQSLADAKTNKPTTPRQWRLAEAAFLLRMGNYWLQFEGDVSTALSALQRADDVLLAVQAGGNQDEYDLLPVRSALAQEVLALQAVQPVDVQGIYLRLQALAENVPAVRQGLSLQAQTEAADAGQSASFVDAMAQELGKFVRLTDLAELTSDDASADDQVDAGPAAILAARRAVIAALERAQIAALRHHDEAYQASLADAQQAARQLAAPADPQLTLFLQQLAQMMEQPLNTEMPKISGSLRALSQTMDTL
ncbi:MAG TPA: hypothetical protein DE147_10440 [Gammaproteobacteria bacterium]|nr:hypothetical protein [Gammaproteobacteria bacterium]